MKSIYKIFLSFVFLIFCFGAIKAQINLVYNGFFENYNACTGNINTGNVINWTVSSSPDFYDTCNNTLPLASGGYQQDCCGGAGYIGEYFVQIDNQHPQNNNYKEYIHTKLIDTLKANHTYIGSLYLSRANYSAYGIVTAGLLFTDTAISQSGIYVSITANPQVKNKILLRDSLNWIMVQDTFKATGTEVYLTVGNFNSTNTSDTTLLQPILNNGDSWQAAYYYIDGVSVYDITTGVCNNLWDAGFDKYILAGDSIRLGAINTDNSTYAWVNSISGLTFLNSNTDARPWSKPSVTTTYYVTKTCPNNNVFIDTVTVYVQQTTGIKKVATNNVQLTLYPNPSTGKLYISNFTASQKNADIEVSDVTGKLITKQQSLINDGVVELNLDVNNGVYFVKVITGNGNIQVQKIIINK